MLEAVWLKHRDLCLAGVSGAALIFDLPPALARSKIWAGATVCQRQADGGIHFCQRAADASFVSS